MRLEVRNEKGQFFPYSNFTSLSVTQSIDQFSGTFNFSAVDVEGELFDEDYPLKMGALCRVTIDNVPVLVGYIEVIDIESDAVSHSVNISGRDITCDLIDSSVPAEISFSDADMSLADIINEIQIAVGLTKETLVPERRGRPLLPVINEIDGLENYEKGEIEMPSAGQQAFDFLQETAKKRQALLTKNGNGSIVITQSGLNPLGRKFIRRRNDTRGRNNILRSAASYDNSDRYSRYIFGSTANLQELNLAGVHSAEAIVDLEVGISDEEMTRKTRTLYILDENSSDIETMKLRAEWELNIRKTRSKVYSCTVSDHTVSPGVPYWFNKIATVQDDICGINASMLVKSLTFTENLTGDQETSFEFVMQGGYSTETEEEATVTDTNIVGDPFVLLETLSNVNIDDFINNTLNKSASDLIDGSSS